MTPSFLRVLQRWLLALLTGLVRGYRLLLSPWLRSACRFEPSCSAYALESLTRHGSAAGIYMTLHRLVRCGPWCEGGHDPVPARAPRLFRYLSGDTARAGTSSSSSTARPNP